MELIFHICNWGFVHVTCAHTQWNELCIASETRRLTTEKQLFFLFMTALTSSDVYVKWRPPPQFWLLLRKGSSVCGPLAPERRSDAWGRRCDRWNWSHVISSGARVYPLEFGSEWKFQHHQVRFVKLCRLLFSSLGRVTRVLLVRVS